MIDEKILDVCFDHECENWGKCALNIDFENNGDLDYVEYPDCRYYYLKKNNIKFRGADNHELNDEEMWNVFSKPVLDKS